MDETQSATGMEARRRRAVQRVIDGWSQADVAAFLGVHPVTVNKWVRAYRAAGDDGLARKPHPGRPAYLSVAEEKKVLGWLTEKPTKHGFNTDLWTANRVARLIREKLGVEFHPNYLREWLSKRGLTPQKPAKRAQERDLHVVGRWLAEEWPSIQKKGSKNTPTSC